MKDTIKRIWNDPVWSKVIATIIVAALGALCSLSKGWLSETETVSEAFKTIFCFKFNVWITGLILIVIFCGQRFDKAIQGETKNSPTTTFRK